MIFFVLATIFMCIFWNQKLHLVMLFFHDFFLSNILLWYLLAVRASIEQTSQHPDSLQYLSQLEDYSKYQRTDSIEEVTAQRPQFIRPLHDLGQLQEGRNAHFEAQLTPVSDPTMKVEWYKDGRSITASKWIALLFNLVLLLLHSIN